MLMNGFVKWLNNESGPALIPSRISYRNSHYHQPQKVANSDCTWAEPFFYHVKNLQVAHIIQVTKAKVKLNNY